MVQRILSTEYGLRVIAQTGPVHGAAEVSGFCAPSGAHSDAAVGNCAQHSCFTENCDVGVQEPVSFSLAVCPPRVEDNRAPQSLAALLKSETYLYRLFTWGWGVRK